MPNFVDLTGKRFGPVAVLRFSHMHKSNAHWFARCDCGVEWVVSSCNLKRRGACRSCWRAAVSKARTTHGESMCRDNTKEYRAWGNMLSRCTNPKVRNWHVYGGRGIKVCGRWKSYENFLEDMGRAPSAKHSIDRIDVDGDYCPENCKWSTRIEQMRNRQNNRMITIDGVTKCLAEWCAISGLGHATIHQRTKRGWHGKELLAPINSLYHTNS